MKKLLIGTACICAFSFISTSVSAVAVSGQGTWESTLKARDLDGNINTIEAYYDTVLNITWLAGSNIGVGTFLWNQAMNSVAQLDFNGITGWRLPHTNPVDGIAYNYTYLYDGTTDVGFKMSAPGTIHAGSTGSEMAHMYYNTLGNVPSNDTSGNPNPNWGVINTGPFDTLRTDLAHANYWSETRYTPNTALAWSFNLGGGEQLGSFDQNGYNTWAVHDGDVGAPIVPVPASVWLFSSGLLGLVGIAKRKRTT